MITIFSTFRPFTPPFDRIQRNTILHWKKLKHPCQIVIFGEEEGVEGICKEFELTHIKNVVKSEEGTPMMDDMFKKVEEIAKFDNLLLVSGDILIFDDIFDALEMVAKPFMIGVRRWDIDIEGEFIKEKAVPGPLAAGDFFLFSKGFYKDIPPFIIGKSCCDNWLYAKANQKRVSYDGSNVITIFHQNHPRDPNGIEFDYNQGLIDINDRYESIENTTFKLNNK